MTEQNAADLWVYSPSLKNFVDEYITLADGRQVTGYSHRTIEQVREEYADAQVMEYTAALAAQEAAFSTHPARTTREVFHQMLNVLPPMGWVGSGSESSESFKMCEMLCGRITVIYARRGSDFFEMHDKCTMKHADIMAAIDKAFPLNPQSIHITGRRWAGRNGSTYCTAEIQIDGEFYARTEKEYGYGDYYRQAAFEQLAKDEVITWIEGHSGAPTVWARETGISLTFSVIDVRREKDL